MNYVFITGANGFIGEHIVQKFIDEGWYVIALVHHKISAKLKELEKIKQLTYIQGDICNLPSFSDALNTILKIRQANLHSLIHCAAYVSDVGRSHNFKKTNYLATIALAKLAENLHCRFVYISTTDVYGMKDFNGESEEQAGYCNNNKNSYPKFKIAAEQWLKNNFPSNQYVIIRPAAVWGLNDSTLTKRFIDFLRWSPCIIHFGKWKGKNRWPLAHVKNVATAAFIAATETTTSGTAINVVDSEKVSIDEFYRMLIQTYFANKKYLRINIPIFVFIPFAWLITKLSNFLNLKKPLLDPSLYALFSVSSNLDFSNELFVDLANKTQQKLITYREGVEELIINNVKSN